MNYLVLLDYGHLDNGVFLTSFARALSQQQNAISQKKNGRAIILHADSEYTERLIQTGMMREEARVRAVRDLNHRLIALLADQGVSAIGLNGFQKSMVRTDGAETHVNRKEIERLPHQPYLLLSNLAADKDGKPVFIPLADYAEAIRKELNIQDIILFSTLEKDELLTRNESDEKKTRSATEPEISERLPDQFNPPPFPVLMSTTEMLTHYPSKTGMISINPA